ncbi:MAG: MBL fold metallo-hydrolase [Actinomycetota bacterium]|nr:MBL fold metallo-hydrolase [Actinomycetota bacterium]
MRLTKLGHACVRIEHSTDDGRAHVIVLDPGVLTEPEAVDGATAVLVTHEHADHYSADHLRRANSPVFTIAAVADRIRADAPDVAERVRVVEAGEEFDAGVPVRTVGDKHAVIHPELPRFDNSGYLLDIGGRLVFHPGDALTPPGCDVEVLLLPVSAPWLKVSEAIDFAREVKAPTNLAIHDLVYSEIGLGIIDSQLERFLGERGQSYLRRAPGEDL